MLRGVNSHTEHAAFASDGPARVLPLAGSPAGLRSNSTKTMGQCWRGMQALWR